MQAIELIYKIYLKNGVLRRRKIESETYINRVSVRVSIEEKDTRVLAPADEK